MLKRCVSELIKCNSNGTNSTKTLNKRHTTSYQNSLQHFELINVQKLPVPLEMTKLIFAVLNVSFNSGFTQLL